MRFTDAHAPTAVCTPTRYAILTGRYSWRSRLQRNVLGPWDPPLIAADRLTVPKLLKLHGYTTVCLGKWHLGWAWPTKNGQPARSGADRLSNVDFTRPIGNGPITRGFDAYFGVDLPNYPPYCFIEGDRTVGIPSQPNLPEHNRPGPMVPGWDWVEIMPELTRRAVRRIEETAATSPRTPLFLYLALTAPHYPVVPAAEFRGKSEAGAFGDFVQQVDATVGRVLDALKRTGLAEDTLVIFTSDNGPEITGEVKPGVYDRAQQYGHFSMGPLRGAKRDAWEGGHRVAFLARWPGKVAAGTVSDQTIAHVDLMATLAALLETRLPDNAGEDSVNLLPVLLGKQGPAPIREATVFQSASGKFVLRKGDWVLIDARTGDDNAKRGEPAWFKQLRGYTPHDRTGELYDLRHDLSQRHNVYTERPEVVRALKELLEQYKRDGRSTPGAPQKNDVPILDPPYVCSEHSINMTTHR
jgi:arylsulfatase A-like enzyme